MAVIEAYVTFDVPDTYLDEGNFNSTYDYIVDEMKEIAEGLQGIVYDLEIK